MKIELEGLSKYINKSNNDLKEKISISKEKLLQINNENTTLTGWIDYPINITEATLNDIMETANEVKNKCEVLVVIGVGGSYLGTKAVLECLKSQRREQGELKIIFAGFSLSSTYTSYLLKYLEKKTFCINYVSKSGTTTEPAIAFRLFKNLLKKQHKSSYNDWIYVTTNSKEGNALKEAKAKNYKVFYIPDNIGGRYSCFTPCTLFPLACKDVDIREFIKGGQKARLHCLNNEFDDNIALKYAFARRLCYDNGKQVEALCLFSPRLLSLLDWWKQLYAESEGKNGKGILPIGMLYSTDLHSVGQIIQDGPKLLFETIVDAKYALAGLSIPDDEDDFEEINYLVGKDIHYINNKMMHATVKAHMKGNVPIIRMELDKIDTYNLGYLMYTFMFSCAVSAYAFDVNPFDQPAVSEYKNKMYELLGKNNGK